MAPPRDARDRRCVLGIITGGPGAGTRVPWPEEKWAKNPFYPMQVLVGKEEDSWVRIPDYGPRGGLSLIEWAVSVSKEVALAVVLQPQLREGFLRYKPEKLFFWAIKYSQEAAREALLHRRDELLGLVEQLPGEQPDSEGKRFIHTVVEMHEELHPEVLKHPELYTVRRGGEPLVFSLLDNIDVAERVFRRLPKLWELYSDKSNETVIEVIVRRHEFLAKRAILGRNVRDDVLRAILEEHHGLRGMVLDDPRVAMASVGDGLAAHWVARAVRWGWVTDWIATNPEQSIRYRTSEGRTMAHVMLETHGAPVVDDFLSISKVANARDHKGSTVRLEAFMAAPSLRRAIRVAALVGREWRDKGLSLLKPSGGVD